jgi:hypothetical protein
MKTFNSAIKNNINKYFFALVIATSVSTSWAAFDDAGTQYSTDKQNYRVWNQALKPIDLVNSILCFTGQFKPNNFVNLGPYIALADEKRCFPQEEDDASSQSAGSSNTPTYAKIIVDATRGTGPNDPLLVKAWIPGLGDSSIKIKTVISLGASTENPFGSFTFNYEMFDNFVSNVSVGKGEIKTVSIPNKIGFTFFESEMREGQTSNKNASVVMSSDRTTGIALTSDSHGGQGQGAGLAFGLAFNPSNVLLQTADTYANLRYKPGNNGMGTESCLSRTVFDETVWRYDLYNVADGSRVELKSGVGFKYDSDGDATFDAFGHVGYWGIWAEKPDMLLNGATIQVSAPGSNTFTPYTVVKAPGRLIKNTVQQLTLSEAHGIDFSYWNPDAQQSNFNNWTVQYLTIALDSVSADGFYKTAGNKNGPDGPMEVPLMTPVLVTLQAHQFLNMNSQQLGGTVRFTQGDSFLTFFKQEFINGSETAAGGLFANGTATLYCVDRCPVGTLGATELASWNSAYSAPVTNPMNAIAFNISNTGINPLALVRNSNEQIVKFADGLTQESLQQSNSPNAWGVRSGSLITAAVLATLTNSWEINNPSKVTVFYEWETGLNSFNKTTSIKNAAGVIQTFDKPLQITYTHTNAKDRTGNAGDFNNKLLLLNYGGNGELWGIPHSPSSSGNGRRHPLFNIKDATIIGATNQYVVRARQIEGAMQATAGQCTSLALTEPAAPVPTSVTGVADIGNMPIVTTAPAVIGGVVQAP